MKAICSTILLLIMVNIPAAGKPAGFYLPDSVQSMTLSYRTVEGLVVLPVTINDSIAVNLVLDTGCRNLVLFGKRFVDRFNFQSGRPVMLAGLGEGRPVSGKLSLDNKVSIHEILGERIPVIVTATNNLFAAHHRVDGIIGYDIFVKFEVEVDPRKRMITFRPAHSALPPAGYTTVPLQVVDTRPVLQSYLHVTPHSARALELMIDTGSALGLLLKTADVSPDQGHIRKVVLGRGINGPVSGYEVVCRKLEADGLSLEFVRTGIVRSRWHEHASVGMEVLKAYAFVLNYCRQYAGFRPYVSG